MQAIGEIHDETWLQERLAAGEGDAAAGRGEDIRVREKLAGELRDGPGAPANDFRPLGTGPCERRAVVWRDGAAVPAMDALLLLEEDFGLWGQALRVVAPGAAERTTLEEDGGAYARTVVQAEFPHLEEDRCFFVVHA